MDITMYAIHVHVKDTLIPTFTGKRETTICASIAPFLKLLNLSNCQLRHGKNVTSLTFIGYHGASLKPLLNPPLLSHLDNTFLRNQGIV